MARKAIKTKGVKGSNLKAKRKASDRKFKIGARSVSEDNYQKLLAGVMGKLAPHYSTHLDRVSMYKNTLYQLAATTTNKGTEKDKEKAYALGETDIVSDMRYPKTLGHVNNITASVMNVLFPARAMYGSIEVHPDQQEATSALVAAMNAHARSFKHYTNYYLGIHDAIAFNFSAIEVTWRSVTGVTGDSRPQRSNLSRTTNSKVIREGNDIRHLDIFNTIVDVNAQARNYAEDAELYATINKYSEFDLQRMHERGEILLPKEVRQLLRVAKYESQGRGAGPHGVNHGGGYGKSCTNSALFYQKHGNKFGLSGSAGVGLYTQRPDFRSRTSRITKERTSNCDESEAFSLDSYNGIEMHLEEKPNAFNEIIDVVLRCYPEDLGLSRNESNSANVNSSDDTMEIWRIKILNGDHVVYAQPEATSHGLLPCAISRPKKELSESLSLGITELLHPFQEASSSLMNMFIKQVRSDKNKGITIHDERIRLDQHADPSSGYIKADLSDMNKEDRRPLRDMVANIQGHPVNTSTLTADAHIETRMQDVFPTNSIDQLAGLNRPVTHQSRQVTQLQNLPVFIMARIIHEELVEPITFMQTQDILQYQRTLKIFDNAGQLQTIDPSVFKDVELDIAVSDGLRGIDTIAIADRLEKLVQFAFQSRRVQQEIDVVAMTGYLLQMEGARIDLDSFKYKTPFDSLPEEQKNAAFALLQQTLAEEGEETETPAPQ